MKTESDTVTETDRLQILRAIGEPNRLKLLAWVEEQARLSAKSSLEWTGRSLEQAAYRSGEWFSYNNMRHFLTDGKWM